MAQTEGAMNSIGGKIELSVNGTPTWTNISGFINMVDPGQSVRQTGVIYTADGDTPILGGGKREPLEIVVSIAYTEGVSDPFTVIEAAHLSGSQTIQLQWSPAGGGVGDYEFTSDSVGLIKNLSYPPIDPNSPAPTIVTFTIETLSYTLSTII